MTLLDALQRSFAFAQEFNQRIGLSQALKRLGFMREMKQLPGLLKQEREALSCSLKILFKVQGDSKLQGTEHAAEAVDRLMRISSTVLQNYANKERQLSELADARRTRGEVPAQEATAQEIERE